MGSWPWLQRAGNRCAPVEVGRAATSMNSSARVAAATNYNYPPCAPIAARAGGLAPKSDTLRPMRFRNGCRCHSRRPPSFSAGGGRRVPRRSGRHLDGGGDPGTEERETGRRVVDQRMRGQPTARAWLARAVRARALAHERPGSLCVRCVSSCFVHMCSDGGMA